MQRSREKRLFNLGSLAARFGLPSNSFQTVDECPRIQREASATIMWRTIGDWQPLPVLWNIFPFHPHQPDKPLSNRTPKASEIEGARPFLTALRHLFPDVTLVAVGKKASRGLAKWDLAHTAVRHPSQGGAKQFAAALRAMRA